MRVHAALLAIGNESAMNLEPVGGVYRHIYLFSAAFFAYWEQTSYRTWLARQSESEKPHRAGPGGLA
jgi:hypothetical protein